MPYLSWKEEKITDFSEAHISDMYDRGFVFTRINKGVMQQTRSVRIDLSKFELTSENRRILKKVEGVEIKVLELPWKEYDWSIGKLGKDFYEARDAEFSANKIKELLTAPHNFNTLLKFSDKSYAICYSNSDILHYSYPFYEGSKVTGLGMMLGAIVWAKEKGLKYIYLGSLQRPTDTYKLQFAGLEWFDGKEWSDDMEKVKRILTEHAK